jgi:arylsulfatase A-like enzyme
MPRGAARRALILAALLAVPAAVFLFRPAGTQTGPRPDILLVTFDTLRADHCSSYGYPLATTPHLDALARDGVRFALAYAPTATTAPSHASLLTGLQPLGHGVLRNGFVLAGEVDTLAERLGRAGYTTAAFVSSFVLYHEFGLAQGFGFYDDDLTRSEATQAEAESWEGVAVPGRKTDRRADAVTGRALAWLEEARGRSAPRFVWVHYMDPHEPYAPPDGLLAGFGAPAAPGSLAEAVRRYDAEIAFADRELGRLLRAFTAAAGPEGAWIVATADHGESFGEHGWRGHGTQLYEESLRVPLVMRWTGRLPAAHVVESPVALHDLAPTLLGVLGLPPLEGPGVGTNLAPLWASPPRALPERALFFQRRAFERDGRIDPIPLRELGGAVFGGPIEVRGQKFGVRSGSWKYSEARAEPVASELYDLASDPGETRNVVAEHPELAARLSERIGRWRAEHRHARPPAPQRTVSPEEEAMLRALGYVEPEAPAD